MKSFADVLIELVQTIKAIIVIVIISLLISGLLVGVIYIPLHFISNYWLLGFTYLTEFFIAVGLCVAIDEGTL